MEQGVTRAGGVQDAYGSYEWALGMAMLAGFLLMRALWRLPWLALPLFWAVMALSLWYGRQLDLTRAYAVGRRQARSLVSLPVTWISLIWALILTGALLWWARSRGWNALPGWADGPLFALLVLGFYHLGAGVRANVARYVYLGLSLCLLAVLISVLAPLRERIYLATALLGGGVLLVCARTALPPHGVDMATRGTTRAP